MLSGRLTALAKAAKQVIDTDGQFESLFSTSLAPYDFTIKLRKDQVPKKTSKYKNLQAIVKGTFPNDDGVVANSCNEARRFYDEISNTYAGACLFFSDVLAMDSGVIAGMWLPEAKEPRKFRVNLEYATVPDGSKVTLDQEGIISEIKRIGGDLINKVDVK
jgi:U3 small nucleolar RNA-associated protein 22